MTLHLVIDTDTASDDAVALLMAASAPDVAVDAVTVVAGNVDLGLALKNALYTMHFAGAGDVPVYAGLDRPLLRPLSTATQVHGDDGMGDSGVVKDVGHVASGHAVDVLCRLAAEAPGERTLVTLGPLTNVAAAVTRDRELLTKYAHVYLMAGSPDAVGNISATAEYNVWVDPEAASIVLQAPGELTLIGWNISRLQAVMGVSEQERLAAIRSERAWFVQTINRRVDRFCREVTGLAGYDLPDPVAMAVALQPALVQRSEKLPVAVALSEEVRGQLVVDHRLPQRSEANAEVVWEVDEQAWKELLFATCERS